MAIDIIHITFLALCGFLITTIFTGVLIKLLIRQKIFDIPNERSSHAFSVPRGGGISVLIVIILCWLLDRWITSEVRLDEVLVLAIAAGLGIVCFLDDIRGLSPLKKFSFQVISVTLGLYILGPEGGLFSAWLPVALDLPLTGVLWLWFLNLFNFMDGIDGITGTQMLTLGLGLALLSASGIFKSTILGPSIVIAASALGFLVWNWSPAKIFMGDVGSIPIGYLIGWLLIAAVNTGENVGQSAAAIIILPGYYLIDASTTLIVRLLKRKNIFLAHREHFYQNAVDRGVSHTTVCYSIASINALLMGIIWFVSDSKPVASILLSVIVIVFLLLWMRGGLVKSITNQGR